MSETRRVSEEELKIERLLKQSFLGEFLHDENITDISYDGSKLRIQDNIKGRYIAEKQPSYDEVYELGKKIANIQGKEWTNNTPLLNTELSHLRVNYVHHTVSPSGCTFALRVSRPKLVTSSISDFSNDSVAKLLAVLIEGEYNMIIAGRTGSGKTELQKLLVNYIDDFKKITLIEDTMDSHIKEIYPDKDVNSWRTLMEETRENKITYQTLIKEGLRNNPDWLIVAETRDADSSYDMLESALTDHSIVTTIHARGAKAIPTRILRMIGQRFDFDERILGQDIVDTLKIGIYLRMEFTDEGIKRYIREIYEYTDFNDGEVEYIPLYQFKRVYNENTGEYEDVVETNPLSEQTIEDLTYKKLIHKVPSVFLRKARKEEEDVKKVESGDGAVLSW